MKKVIFLLVFVCGCQQRENLPVKNVVYSAKMPNQYLQMQVYYLPPGKIYYIPHETVLVNNTGHVYVAGDDWAYPATDYFNCIEIVRDEEEFCFRMKIPSKYDSSWKAKAIPLKSRPLPVSEIKISN